jgi:PKHD-type hydroxylase
MQTSKIEPQFSPLFVYWHGAFTNAEIDRIVELGLQKPLDDGVVNNGENPELHASRTCTLNWMAPDSANNWIFHKLQDAFLQLNDMYFKFELDKFEPFQFTRYGSDRKEFYGKHIDCSRGALDQSTSRKLSVTLQLSDAVDYEGGDLLLHGADKPDIAPRKKGMLVLFPSYVLHEVTPVTAGTRYSLVTWAHGPLFR